MPQYKLCKLGKANCCHRASCWAQAVSWICSSNCCLLWHYSAQRGRRSAIQTQADQSYFCWLLYLIHPKGVSRLLIPVMYCHFFLNKEIVRISLLNHFKETQSITQQHIVWECQCTQISYVPSGNRIHSKIFTVGCATEDRNSPHNLIHFIFFILICSE
jgi:hypothetical protein